MMNSLLADVVTAAHSEPNNTCVEYANFCTTKQNRIKFER